jgi:hypothetical protein
MLAAAISETCMCHRYPTDIPISESNAAEAPLSIAEANRRLAVTLERAVFGLNQGGFPNRGHSDSTCWLGGSQLECRSHIRKTCATGLLMRLGRAQ